MKNNLLALKLQMFAGNPNTNVTGDDGLSAENKVFYDKRLIDEAGPNLVHAQFGQKRPIPKNGGKTIEFRKYSNLPKATTALTEGVTPDGKKLNVTDITAAVSQYGDYVTLSDILELTAIDNNVVEATRLLGKQAGLTLDTVVRNILNAGTNVSYCPKLSGDGTVETVVTSRAAMDITSRLTVKVIQKAVAKLRGQNAPTINGDYIAIVHPYALYDLMRDKEWIDAHKYAKPENIFEGEVGKIGGVRFVQTTEAKVWNDSTCPTYNGGKASVYSTLIFGSDAFGVTEIEGGGLETFIKQKGSAGSADPLNQRSTVGWKATLTAERLVENYMVRVESCVADFAQTPAN